ncbi:MAG: hypothetical protein KME20_21180 [Kaiparowitsia implicata GSE-PSE-MK54-09C]|jgi:hypothetical protein|nr:hypothetical protein [Kaiparowitsia implicata GSE-PSE-MK54-09C]
MTLLLNQSQSSEHLQQLEIQGVLPGEIRPETTIDEDKGRDVTTFQVSSYDPTHLSAQLASPEPAQLIIYNDLGQNYNTENLSDKSKSSDHKISQVIASQYGFRTNFWSDKIIKKKWAEFIQIGPEYAMPIKCTACSSPFLDSPGSVYAGLYAKDKFDNLAHFQMYNLFILSIQQALFQTGEVDLDWFCLEEEGEGTDRFNRWNRTILKFPQKLSIEECFAQVDLPTAVHWVNDLHFYAWAFERREGVFEVQADCLEGYLTMFTVDD